MIKKKEFKKKNILQISKNGHFENISLNLVKKGKSFTEFKNSVVKRMHSKV